MTTPSPLGTRCPPYSGSRTRTRAPLGTLRALLLLALITSGGGDAPTDPDIDPATLSRLTATSELAVWWPTDEAWLEGVQPFKARLEGYPLAKYRMYWQVDGGSLTEMWNSGDGGAHKEAAVDVGPWTWRGTGPYIVTFVAKSRKGAVLATRSIAVHVGPGPEAPSLTLDIAAPAEGASLSGLQLFRARVPELSLADQVLTWRVDGGAENPMVEGIGDPPYHEAAVEVSLWTWAGTGPYTVTFTARDAAGTILVSEDVTVYVGADGAETPPAPENPLVALPFWVDPYSNASKQADAWRSTRPEDAALMDRIASQSQADWFGDWNRDIETAVRDRVSQIAGAGALAVLVAYNIPVRDCSGYSGGGASSPDAYRAWIRAFAAGIGDRSAAVVLEPDALALMDCLTAEQRTTRLALLRDAVQVLEAQPNVAVYLDAGHAAWHAPATIGARLRDAGIDAARGFAINTSNFQTTAAGLSYGDAVSAEVGGKPYVIDTSRNGLGPTSDNQWCNPPGRALGNNPTPFTGHPLADAFLWVKRPGESDGTCNGGPSAGSWWADYALELARNQPTVLASSD